VLAHHDRRSKGAAVGGVRDRLSYRPESLDVLFGRGTK
jgi:hypothetical protein